MQAYHQQVQNRNTAGFTLIFSILIASIVLAIGLGIFSIVFRELQLSTITRDSNIALYAADAGAECALYWEFKDYFVIGQSGSIVIRCSDSNVTVPSPLDNGITTTWNFMIPVGVVSAGNESCAEIRITKNNTTLRTTIESSGRNEGGDNNCAPTSRTVERTLELNF